MDLKELLRRNRTIRVMGFDDAPFTRPSCDPVPVAGVVCAGTRFEGMVWDQVEADGWDATDVLCRMVIGSKFHSQIHLVLLDGISVAGMNVIHLPALAQEIERPCVSVMRRPPNLEAMEYVIRQLPDPQRRWAILQQAGTIHPHPPFYFQVEGADPAVIAPVLERLTDRGHVPEALRIAHLVTAAVVKGESGRQA